MKKIKNGIKDRITEKDMEIKLSDLPSNENTYLSRLQIK